MVNMLYCKIRVNDGFSISKVVTSTQDKKKDKEHRKSLQISKVWKYKHYWTKLIRKYKNKRTDQLGDSYQVVSKRLREMGKIQKIGRWVLYELKDKQMEKRKNT